MMRTSSGHPRREVLAGSALAAALAIALTACSPAPPSAAFPTATARPTPPRVTSPPNPMTPNAPTASSAKTQAADVERPETIRIIGNPSPTSQYGQVSRIVIQYLEAQVSALDDKSARTLKVLASTECIECRNDVSVVQQRLSDRQRVIGIGGKAGWSSITLYSRRSVEEGTSVVRAEYVQRPQRLVDARGSVIGQRAESVTFVSTFVLRRVGDSHRVISINTQRL